MVPSKSPPKDQLIMGLHSIEELLRYAPEKIIQVFMERPQQEGRKQALFRLCQKHNISVHFISFDLLTQITGSDAHQSVAAQIQSRHFIGIKEFLSQSVDRDRSLVLMLDQILDPQNFGALLRCAECLGADAVIWSKNRGAELTPTVAKASSGASELLSLVKVSNLAETVPQMQAHGYEAIASLLDPKAQNVFQHLFAPKTLLILGSEGEGIQPLLAKRADKAVYIPMQGKIQSLNVSQSAAILMGQYLAQQSLAR